jgi:hypothetical protein
MLEVTSMHKMKKVIFFFLLLFIAPIQSSYAATAGLPCASGSPDNCRSIHTAIEDIPTTPADFVGRVFSIILSIGGGVALLLIIQGGYNLAISQGNP